MELIRKPVALALALLLLPLTVSATTTLRYTDHEPAGAMRTRFIEDVLFPAIEKESQGRLKIEAHWGGELSTGYDALRTVGDGINWSEVASSKSFHSLPFGPCKVSYSAGWMCTDASQLPPLSASSDSGMLRKPLTTAP